MFLKEFLKKTYHYIHPYFHKRNKKAINIVQNYKIAQKYKRIYHYHIRKTAGTSLNMSFLVLTGKNPDELYPKLSRSKFKRLILKDKVYVGWNKLLIEQGHYFYAFSHIPMHKIKVPDDSFTITILRDPVKRAISYYNMLKSFEKNNPAHPVLKTEGQYLGESFADFLKKAPVERLSRQLYMFSKEFNTEEAFENISKVNFVMSTENFEEDLKKLGKKLKLKLQSYRSQVSQVKYTPTVKELEILETLLEKEIFFYKQVTGG